MSFSGESIVPREPGRTQRRVQTLPTPPSLPPARRAGTHPFRRPTLLIGLNAHCREPPPRCREASSRRARPSIAPRAAAGGGGAATPRSASTSSSRASSPTPWWRRCPSRPTTGTCSAPTTRCVRARACGTCSAPTKSPAHSTREHTRSAHAHKRTQPSAPPAPPTSCLIWSPSPPARASSHRRPPAHFIDESAADVVMKVSAREIWSGSNVLWQKGSQSRNWQDC